MHDRELLIEKYIPPTRIDWDGDEYWINKNKEQHSFNGQPCRIHYHSIIFPLEERVIYSKTWKKNGEYYRKNKKPNYIVYNGDGKVTNARWYEEQSLIKNKYY